MKATTPIEIEALKKVGRVVALAIQTMKAHTKPGITTKELDEIGMRVLQENGAESAPMKMYLFPGATCISVNQEVAHGIPGEREIKAGDLVNIDVSAELAGYYADSGHSFQVPPVQEHVSSLCTHTQKTLDTVIAMMKPGTKLNEIGHLIESHARKGGYAVIRNLCSHGIGKSLHEEPEQILNYYDPKDKRELTDGLVLTIEPFLSTGASIVTQDDDGWTLRVPDHSLVAQHEHTIIVTKEGPIITTQL